MKFPQEAQGRFARKAVLVGASAALALTMMPASAFAAVGADGKVTYTMPTAAKSIQETKTDAKGNTYVQRHLSVYESGRGAFMARFSILGIDNASLGRAAVVSNGSTESTQYGLFASDANINPDTYIYNYCAYRNGATVATDAMAYSGTNQSVMINGTEYNMPAEIYTESTMILTSSSSDKSGDYTYAEWVALENQRTGRTNTSTYNPAFVTLSGNAGGLGTMTQSMYAVAETCDQVIDASKDANGNYTLASRYAEGPNTYSVAADFEDIVKGTQYYVLSKIASGAAEKATVAVVCGYDPSTGNYAVRKINTGVKGDYDANVYGGRFSSAVAAIATDMNELGLTPAQTAYVGSTDESTYVGWYTPEQIVESCDAVLVTDAPAGGRVAPYLATASDGNTYAPSETANIAKLESARTATKSAGKSAADLCYKWPASLMGVFYAQGVENVMLSFVGACFLYPELLDLTDSMAWWTKNVWRITDASLQDIVDSTCYGVSLAENQSKIGTISANFEKTIDAAINEGNNYYLEHSAEIDALCDGQIATYNATKLAERTTPVVAEKAANPMKASGKTLKVKAKKTASFGKAKAFSVKKAQGKVTFTKKSGNSKITVSKTGKVKVKKGLKKGTYKVKVAVKAAGNDAYKAATKTVTLTVKAK